MNPILTRIKIKTQGNVEYFIYNTDELVNLIGEKNESEPNESFFNAGSTIRFNDIEYKIIAVRSKLFPETLYSSDNTGVNLDGEEQLAYNFQITLIVEEKIF